MAAISVIVPVYKVEAYLDRCVRSILSQTYEDFELILVDDGSPDRCGALCDDYGEADSRVRVIHQQNGGLSAARNAGIDWVMGNSQSQWLAFVDSDDYIAPEYLERLYHAAKETGCRLSVCGIYPTPGGPLPKAEPEPPEVHTADVYYSGGKIHGGITMVAWNKLYHRSLFENLRYPVGKLHEDEFTTYKAVYEAGLVAVLNAPLYGYFQNPGGIMKSKWNPRRLHAQEAALEQLAFARERGYQDLEEKAIRLYLYGTYEHLKTVLESKDFPQYRAPLRKQLRRALKLGRDSGVFLLCREKLWAYEEAYPCKPLWWLVGKLGK